MPATPLDPSTVTVSARRGAGESGLIQVSVGCEHADDRWVDLERASEAPA